MRSVFTAIFAIFLIGGCRAEEQPLLVVDTGGHSAPIRTVLFTNDSQYLISGGEDKVVRIWSVATGSPVRSIRGQIGSGQPGKIYTAALNAPRNYLALAGWLSDNAVRIHKIDSGDVVGVLRGHRNTVESLSFSPDGLYLASGDAGGVVRIWDVARMKAIGELTGHKGRIHALAFSADGKRLVSGSSDSTLRLWEIPNGRLIAELTGHQKAVKGVAFSPDGSSLASASDDGSLRFWNPRTGEFLKGIPRIVTRPSNLTFTPDGRGLLTTGESNGRAFAGIFSLEKGNYVSTLPAPDGGITSVAISPDGRTAATAGGFNNEILLWNPQTGAIVRKLAGQGQSVWSVAFSSDGRAILFGNSESAQPRPNAYGPIEKMMWLNRDGDNYRVEWGGALKPDIQAVGARLQYRSQSITLGDGPAGEPGALLRVMDGGRVARQILRGPATGYRHLCYTFTSDGRIISGGVGGELTIYPNFEAKPIGLIGHTGAVWSVAISPDNRTLVSGSDDQTIRLWDLATLRNMLTIFVGRDQQWVAWTPEGYYASSVYGEKYVGWHINNGEPHSADYYCVERFRTEFDRPDIVAQQLKEHDIGLAMRAASRSRGDSQAAPLVVPVVTAAIPPEVHILDPENDQVVAQSPNYTVRAFTFSTISIPVTEVIVLINGRAAGDAKINAQSKEIKLDVRLDEGPNVVTVRAKNERGAWGEQSLHIRCAAVPDRKPDLILLAIGVSKYEHQDISLQFADSDAEQIARLFRSQEAGRLFRQVKTRVLLNEQANRVGILDALTWFSREGSAGDIRLLFLSGHGERTGKANDYYFCSYEHDPEELMADKYDVRWNTILDSLTAIPGKAVLMVDTCHAAAAGGGTRTRGLRPVNFDSVLADLKGISGVVVYAASTGTESSLEKSEWRHGAFTKAVLDALSGGVTGKDGIIRTSDLDAWIKDKVSTMTSNQQHALAYYLPPEELLPFPIFSVKVSGGDAGSSAH